MQTAYKPIVFAAWAVALFAVSIRADEALYRYEGDVIPQNPSAGWTVFQPCVETCQELLEDGHFVLEWSGGYPFANYSLQISESPSVPPPTLWVEWRYRSNQPKPPFDSSCDGVFSLFYRDINEIIRLFADTALTPFGQGFINNLSIEDFHLYRFETTDGVNYRVSVDGNVLVNSVGVNNLGDFASLRFGGQGGCDAAFFPTRNEWDFIRYGTVSFGEQIVATDPPSGFVSPLQYPNLDQFHITFDSANYIFVDDITVTSTAFTTPQVLETRRRENDEPSMVEVVLDQPIPLGQTTTFTITDGVTTNIVSYTYGCPLVADNVDSDGDTILDCVDQCPGQDDTIDTDSDGTPDCLDGCPADPNKIDPGQCGCGQPEDNIGDSDGDSVADCIDQCPGGNDTIDLNENNTPDCAEAIPAVSTWGLVVLTLLLLTMAKCALRHTTAENGRQ